MLCFALGTAGLVLASACSGGESDAAPTPPPTFAPAPTTLAPTATPGPSLEDLADLAEQDASPSLPGVYVPLHPGADGLPRTRDEYTHVPFGSVIPICTPEQLAAGQLSTPVCYHSNPPTSGPHGPQTVAWGVLSVAAPKESLVHNMEHGGVIVWVNTNNQAVITELTRIVNAAVSARRVVVMSRYVEMEPETVALTSWTRLDKFPASDFTADRVTNFITAHERRYNPEGF